MNTLKTTLWASVGLFALAALVAMPAAADQQILDDLIVDGSACIGQDCVNGESFGFDTIRIKENNLRIRAVDTSSTASFPTRDWQITFNDSANGGANKFSIDNIDNGKTPMTIEDNAPSHSLYVDDGGRLGIRTSTPVADVHIRSGNTPTLRLEQDGSSGFTPQTWDVAGNEANFFIRDATNGSTLPIRLRPGAPSSAIDIASTGDVGFGTTSPAEPIHVLRTDASPTRFQVENSNAATQVTGVRLKNSAATWQFELSGAGNFQISEDASGGPEFLIDVDAVNNQVKFAFNDGGTDLLNIQADGDLESATGVYGMISDRNAKQDITTVDAADVLARVAAMPISTWRYKANSDEMHIGPMAQDFWAAFGLHEGPTSLALNDLSGVALAAIQGLNQEIQGKDQVIQELLTRVSALEAKLTD